jgi:hypothetical protein
MSSPRFEAFLARLYTDENFRARFLADIRGEAERHNLSDEECTALEKIDRVGLEMAARSFGKKRESKRANKRSWLRTVVDKLQLRG